MDHAQHSKICPCVKIYQLDSTCHTTTISRTYRAKARHPAEGRTAPQIIIFHNQIIQRWHFALAWVHAMHMYGECIDTLMIPSWYGNGMKWIRTFLIHFNPLCWYHTCYIWYLYKTWAEWATLNVQQPRLERCSAHDVQGSFGKPVEKAVFNSNFRL